MKEKTKKAESCRIGSVGGQAVLEGVMMKSRDRYSVAVRLESGDIDITTNRTVPLKNKYKILGWPLIRGVVNFGETLALSYKILEISARAIGVDEEASETKFEKWLREKFGRGIMDVVMVISTVFGVGLGIALFFFLPILVTKGIDALAGGSLGIVRNLIEGIVKIGIFVGYIALVSLMPDIRRTFEYHGAEHKSIFCYESGDELTVENAKKHTRFHPRCGTSFLIFMLLISVLLYSLPVFTWDNMVLRMATKLLFLPLLVALGYEFIRYAGRHNNLLVRILSKPGIWMQRLTTREPDEEQLEVAIAALKSALPEEFPDFKIEKRALAAEPSEHDGTEPSADTANA